MKKLTWKKFRTGKTEVLPGMLLKVHQDRVQYVYLVGDVNKNLGVCDDCTNFEENEIVEYSVDYIEELTNYTGSSPIGTKKS